jgi:hypothetical protein
MAHAMAMLDAASLSRTSAAMASALLLRPTTLWLG